MTKLRSLYLAVLSAGLLAGCGDGGTVAETPASGLSGAEGVAPAGDVEAPGMEQMSGAPMDETVEHESGGDSDATVPTPAGENALKSAVAGEWVDTQNAERRIDFFENGSGIMLSDEGGFTATFYSFIDEDTVSLAGGAGEMDLALEGDQLTIRFTRSGQSPFPYATGESASFQRAEPAE